MEIGIIGIGKMGKDIFNHFFQFEHRFVLICELAQEIEPLTEAIDKQLRKQLKRGSMTEAQYEEKRKAFVVSENISALRECDLVIEAITEIRQIKQQVFESIEKIVKSDCILASNTSSIPLNIVFEKCTKKDRCLGLHFFYPVRVTRTVEVSKTKYTAQPYAETVKALLTRADKNVLELSENANMIMTRMLTTIITQAYKIYEEKYMTIEDIDKVLKEDFVTFGLFEIIDATGIGIIMESIQNYMSDRYRKLYMPLYEKGKQLLAAGYKGGVGNKGLTAYENENPPELKAVSEAELMEYRKNIVLRLQSLLINELVYIINNQSVDRAQINNAALEVFGLSEAPFDMLRRVGSQRLSACLLDSFEKSQEALYQPENLSELSN